MLWLSRCLLSLFVAGCLVLAAVEEPPRPVLRFGIQPLQKSQSEDEIREQYRIVLDWLGERIGYRFVVVGGHSYEDMIELVAQGKVQLAVLSPVPYIQAKRLDPELELLLTELKWNEAKTERMDSYAGFIVSRLDREDVKTVTDLRGKRVAFVNLESTSGWIYPNALLLGQGINIREQATVLFLGSHPRVTEAIVAGSVDAGATWDFNLHEAELKHGKVFRIVQQTQPIPNICLVAHQSVPAEVRARIRELLPAAPAEVFEKAPMCGYVAHPDTFYDVVRTLLDAQVVPASVHAPGSALVPGSVPEALPTPPVAPVKAP